jgi:hypothetical protein
VWKEHLDKQSGSPGIKSADPYATALMDHVHSAGSVRVSAACALMVLLLIVVCPVPGGPRPDCGFFTFLALFLGLFLVLLHQLNYLKLGSQSERFINEVLSDALSSSAADTVVLAIQAKKKIRV